MVVQSADSPAVETQLAPEYMGADVVVEAGGTNTPDHGKAGVG